MKSLFTALILTVFALACPAWADADCPPWVKAQAEQEAANKDLQTSGLQAMSGHVDAFEAALAAMDKQCETPKTADVVVLTDGMMESLVAMAAAGKAHPGQKVVAIHDPYPLIAFYLGSYYNEIGHYEDALRVFDRERAINQGTLGDTRALLVSERAVSLAQLHRLPDALASYEEGLKLANIDDRGKARLQRGRGYVLTEMGRLDEAEAAYNESLKLEPGNQRALGELDYIAKLKMGGKKVPGNMTMPEATKKN